MLPSIYKADFHCHTLYSNDSASHPEALIERARKKGLQKLAITDHNTIQGALAAHKLAPDLIIIGEEIETGRGELLALYVQEEVPPDLPVKETIHRLRQQGAFISVSHPLDHQRTRWFPEDLEEMAPLVDAVEIFNARCMSNRINLAALEFAHQHNLPGTLGSDAHAVFEVGRVWLELPAFNDAFELRNVIHQGKTVGKLSPYWVHAFSRIAAMQKWIRQHDSQTG